MRCDCKMARRFKKPKKIRGKMKKIFFCAKFFGIYSIFQHLETCAQANNRLNQVFFIFVYPNKAGIISTFLRSSSFRRIKNGSL